MDVKKKKYLRSINKAQKYIYEKTTKINTSEIRYDINSIMKGLKYDINISDMTQLLFSLLFGESKSNIFSYISVLIFNSFFPKEKFHYKKERHKIWSDYSKISRENSLNMSKLMYVIFTKDYSYLINHIQNVFSKLPKVLKINLVEIDTMSIVKDESYVVLIVNKIISEKIIFYDLFHKEFSDLLEILKLNFNKKQPYVNKQENDGIEVERTIINFFNKECPSVIHNNLKLLDKYKHSNAVSGKKGEFDLIIGYIDDYTFKIRSVYEIKRSARLIPDDIDKFNCSMNDDFLLDDGTTTYVVEKLKKFQKGYIYINDWNIAIETSFKLRDLLIEYLIKNSRSKSFFMFFLSQIKIIDDNVTIDFNKQFLNKFIVMLDNINEKLAYKLHNHIIWKF